MDPDYAFTDKEEQLRLEHKQQYLDYIKTLRQNRLADKKTRYTALCCLTKLNNCGILTSIRVLENSFHFDRKIISEGLQKN